MALPPEESGAHGTGLCEWEFREWGMVKLTPYFTSVPLAAAEGWRHCERAAERGTNSSQREEFYLANCPCNSWDLGFRCSSAVSAPEMDSCLHDHLRDGRALGHFTIGCLDRHGHQLFP